MKPNKIIDIPSPEVTTTYERVHETDYTFDALYGNTRAGETSWMSNHREIFGTEELMMIDIFNSPEATREYAARLRHQFTTLLDQPEAVDETLRAQLNAELQDYSEATGSERLSPEGLIEADDDIVINFTKFHVEQMRIKLPELQDALEPMRARFIEQGLAAIDEGRLPIARETFLRRSQGVDLRAVDHLRGGVDATLGKYWIESHVAGISDYYDTASQESTVAHEMFHAISGKALLARKSHVVTQVGEITREHDMEKVIFQRNGLAFGGSKGVIFASFDEPITELLTSDLLNRPPHSYKKEIKLILGLEGLMRQAGEQDPRRLFIEAYLEDFDPTAKEKIPAWKKLNKSLSRALDRKDAPSGLVYIEKMIESLGIEEVSDRYSGNIDPAAEKQVFGDSL